MNDALRSKVQDNLQATARKRRTTLQLEVRAGDGDDREVVWQRTVFNDGVHVGLGTEREAALRALWCVAYALSAAANVYPIVPYPALPVAVTNELTYRADLMIGPLGDQLAWGSLARGEAARASRAGDVPRFVYEGVAYVCIGSIGDRFFLWDLAEAQP